MISIWLLLGVELREDKESLAGASGILVQVGLISSGNLRVPVEVELELALEVSFFDLGNGLENVAFVASPASVLPLHECFGVRRVS